MLIDGRMIGQYTELNEHHPISIQRLVDRLHYHDFFKLFPPDVRDAILKKAFHKTYRAGETVYYRGDEDAFMGVVVSGRLRMSMSATDGRGILLGLVETGEIFGETTLIDGLPRTTDAQADTDSSVMIIRHGDFIPALKSNPEAMYGVMKMLCHRMRIYLDTIDIIALQNLPIRLARLILRLAGEYGVEENGHIVIRAGLNQASIGQQVAASRESINKQLKAFVGQRLIDMDGDEITLLNIGALSRIGG
jgi:CRP-like cAMP-binding protein